VFPPKNRIAKRRRNEAIESDIGVGADLFVCWSNTEAREAFDGGWKCAVGDASA